jgi:hypothetical protein
LREPSGGYARRGPWNVTRQRQEAALVLTSVVLGKPQALRGYAQHVLGRTAMSLGGAEEVLGSATEVLGFAKQVLGSQHRGALPN